MYNGLVSEREQCPFVQKSFQIDAGFEDHVCWHVDPTPEVCHLCLMGVTADSISIIAEEIFNREMKRLNKLFEKWVAEGGYDRMMKKKLTEGK